MICLDLEQRNKLKSALTSGKISISSLKKMSDAERHDFFKREIGEPVASELNAKFEQAMLSRQKEAFVKWIAKSTQEGTRVRKDMLTRVGRIQKYLTPDFENGFLKDLAEAKLGIGVTADEAGEVLRLHQAVIESRDKVPESYVTGGRIVDFNKRPKEAIDWATKLADFQKYTQNLKEASENLTWEERKKIGNVGKNILDSAGVTKSFLGSLDNSLMGRQGLPVLLRGNIKLWTRHTGRSFQTFSKELLSKKDSTDVADAIRIEILSRPNSINGNYNKAKNKFGLDVLTDEAYPSLSPEKLPIAGRFFKASSTTFNSTVMQLRADLADSFIEEAVKNGIDITNLQEMTGLGRRVATLTGRGELTTTAPIGKEINLLMFAPRFLRSRFNILTAGQVYKDATPYERKQAAMDTVRIASGIGVVFMTAQSLGFDVDTDPRSGKFGQICMGSKCYDATGGIKGLATLAARITPTIHNGEWGKWSKSGSTGKWSRLNQGEFGESTAWNYLVQFFEGKLSPPAGLVRDYLKGQTYGGDKFTLPAAVGRLVTPIGIQNIWGNFVAGDDDQLISALIEGLGYGASDRIFFPSGKRWMELKATKGASVQRDMLKEATEKYNIRVDKLQTTVAWEKMTNKEQNDAMTKIKNQETDRVLNRFNI